MTAFESFTHAMLPPVPLWRTRTVKMFIKTPVGPGSPWQHAYMERVIGTPSTKTISRATMRAASTGVKGPFDVSEYFGSLEWRA